MPEKEKVQALRGNYISAIGYPIALLAAKKDGHWSGELFLFLVGNDGQVKMSQSTRCKYNLGDIDAEFVISELLNDANRELQIFVDKQREQTKMVPACAEFSLNEIQQEAVIGEFMNPSLKNELEAIRTKTQIDSLKSFLPEIERLGSFLYERTPIK